MNVQELTIAVQSLSFEQRKELIKTLFTQQPELAMTIEAEHKTNGSNIQQLTTQNGTNRNLDWLSANRTSYAGQWVALHEGKLIAHSTNGEALVEPVHQAGVANPFIVFVEPPNTELFVGF